MQTAPMGVSTSWRSVSSGVVFSRSMGVPPPLPLQLRQRDARDGQDTPIFKALHLMIRKDRVVLPQDVYKRQILC